LPPDASIHVRGEVARVLGKHRHPAARGACEALLGEPSWMEVLRARALEGLGHARDAGAYELVAAWTQVEKPARARAAAVAALARLGDEVDSVRTRAVERLVLLVDDDNYRVQISAVSALGTLRDSRAMPVLQRLHAAGGDGRLRRWAYEAMASIREGRAGEESLAGLRREVEGLVEENRKLKDRVSKVEDRR
ncbi:MAG: HEAT repeat domain-containing protein, partial [Deltaproteobacteria bacterium]|nr:HEAT repeat domain-containing protein [Deltaproteobacteria bacterium]